MRAAFGRLAGAASERTCGVPAARCWLARAGGLGGVRESREIAWRPRTVVEPGRREVGAGVAAKAGEGSVRLRAGIADGRCADDSV